MTCGVPNGCRTNAHRGFARYARTQDRDNACSPRRSFSLRALPSAKRLPVAPTRPDDPTVRIARGLPTWTDNAKHYQLVLSYDGKRIKLLSGLVAEGSAPLLPQPTPRHRRDRASGKTGESCGSSTSQPPRTSRMGRPGKRPRSLSRTTKAISRETARTHPPVEIRPV